MESVPIVAATAYPLSYSRVKAFAKGCNEYMPKPIDLSELARVVQSLSQPLTPEFVQTNLIARVIITRDHERNSLWSPQAVELSLVFSS